MTDLFAFGRAAANGASEAGYGLGGDMKKTQYVLQLLGFPGQADTLKCLITAAEVGMEMDAGVLDINDGLDKSSEYLEISPFGMVPALKEADYRVAGASAVMSYIEARGLGKRLSPRNVLLLAEQNYWSDVACTEVGPHVDTLVRQRVTALVDHKHTEAARMALIAPLDALDKQLADKGDAFIIGGYSFADIHWTAYVHLLLEAGEASLLEGRSNIKSWFDRVRTHKSFSGQNLVACDLLPKLEDIREKRLSSIVIDDY